MEIAASPSKLPTTIHIEPIDFMLADCQARSITPEKSANGKLLLRVPPELHAAVLIKAQAMGKSLNQLAIEALSREVSI